MTDEEFAEMMRPLEQATPGRAELIVVAAALLSIVAVVVLLW